MTDPFGPVLPDDGTAPGSITAKPEPDERAPDGFTVAGWRRVSRDGALFWQRARYRDERLLPYAGGYVFVQGDFIGSIEGVYPQTYPRHRRICRPDVDEAYHRARGTW